MRKVLGVLLVTAGTALYIFGGIGVVIGKPVGFVGTGLGIGLLTLGRELIEQKGRTR